MEGLGFVEVALGGEGLSEGFPGVAEVVAAFGGAEEVAEGVGGVGGEFVGEGGDFGGRVSSQRRVALRMRSSVRAVRVVAMRRARRFPRAARRMRSCS